MTQSASASSPVHSTPIRATPDIVASLRGAPASFRVAAKAALRLRKGRLTVTLPDGRVLVFEGREAGPSADITMHEWRFMRRIVMGGIVGVSESYVDGDWDTSDLAALLGLFSRNLDNMTSELRGNQVVRWINRAYHRLRPNTRAGARRNIYAHYDLGNQFYAQWLDETMTYSAALYAHPGQSLADAQTRKYAALCDALELREGERVLEIGCGWGGFAEYAARERKAHVTGVTISQEQHDYARQRLRDGQLSHLADIQLTDYRDISGVYDKVASIEMFEAVGEKFWPGYFEKVSNSLKPGGRAGLQIITIRDDLFERYRKGTDFIQRYIFPGGMLPSVSRLNDEFARAGLATRNVRAFGEDYANTLAQWTRAFGEKWSDIEALGFDERFRRLWSFYLAYCEAGFRTGRTDVAQFTVQRA